MFPLFVSGKAGAGAATGWDLSVYDSDFPKQICRQDIAQDSVANDVQFSTDGTKCYFVGNSTDTIYQYSLSTPWDQTTISYASKSLNFAAQDSLGQSIVFKSDGTSFYLTGNNQTVYQYDLTTAWDLATASYTSKSFSHAAQTTNTSCIEMKPDGTKMYITEAVGGNGVIYQYSLGTAWDISTASYDSVSFSNAAFNTVESMRFKDDGTECYVSSEGTIDLLQNITLSTPWDMSTATMGSASSKVLARASEGMCFGDSGAQLYNADATQHQFELSAVWDIDQVLAAIDAVFDFSAQSTNPRGISNGVTRLIT